MSFHEALKHQDEVARRVERNLAERIELEGDAGVLVRAGGSLGRERALRVTVGSGAENAKLVATLGALLQ